MSRFFLVGILCAVGFIAGCDKLDALTKPPAASVPGARPATKEDNLRKTLTACAKTFKQAADDVASVATRLQRAFGKTDEVEILDIRMTKLLKAQRDLDLGLQQNRSLVALGDDARRVVEESKRSIGHVESEVYRAAGRTLESADLLKVLENLAAADKAVAQALAAK